MWFDLPFFGTKGLFVSGEDIDPLLTGLFVLSITLCLMITYKVCSIIRHRYYQTCMINNTKSFNDYPKNSDGSVDACWNEIE